MNKQNLIAFVQKHAGDGTIKDLSILKEDNRHQAIVIGYPLFTSIDIDLLDLTLNISSNSKNASLAEARAILEEFGQAVSLALLIEAFIASYPEGYTDDEETMAIATDRTSRPT